MTSSTRPDIARISKHLAENNTRVDRFIDGLLGQVDSLVAATGNDDWAKVREISSAIAADGGALGLDELASAARRVATAIDGDRNQFRLRQAVLQLIGTCGRVRAPDAERTADSSDPAT
jgi:hypothetical protein